MTRRGLALLAPIPLCGGCTTLPGALDPAGPMAEGLARLFHGFTLLLGGIWLAVLLVLAAGLWWRRRHPAGPQAGRRAGLSVALATGATALTVIGLSVASYLATRPLHASAEPPLVVTLRGLQWWWEIRYPDPEGGPEIVTANELRLPVGRPVQLRLEAADVIHSFWVPALAGKQDMIPGRDNTLLLTARAPGRHRGQCAEFCGLQHAHMALLVVAEPAPDFAAWLAAQRAPAAPPQEAEAARGRALFEARPCAACHTVRGTAAAGTLGPDLTHLASRQELAAGRLPLTRGALAAWIADPQTLKPGNLMPLVPLAADELQAVTAYLAGLR
ncbi:c-type cytochrome [Pseudoroseomonas cervicalis]|uniref:cytochrome c oxidase subunit II n=1 Tax=Teichococcus cervicalis TaxID=204525 RepID=UPI00278792A1|nr:c-type cytochrome [Pseudoroseomonas cervicalis]MDQ1077612.1 cytochrome c oxidase subunit 2 [Pseudoroseomonas cervicalis]